MILRENTDNNNHDNDDDNADDVNDDTGGDLIMIPWPPWLTLFSTGLFRYRSAGVRKVPSCTEGSTSTRPPGKAKWQKTTCREE